jgi:hypothetical protein
MKVRVYLPETEKAKDELREKLEEAHARIIVDYVKKLDCSENTRAALFDYLNKRALEMNKNEGAESGLKYNSNSKK